MGATVTLTPWRSSIDVDVPVSCGSPCRASCKLLHGDGDVVVFDGEDARHHLDDGDLGAEGVVEVAELHADGAGADDDEALGLGLVEHGLAGAPDLVAIELGEGQVAGDEPVATMMLVAVMVSRGLWRRGWRVRR
jgi:hypothetical protein